MKNTMDTDAVVCAAGRSGLPETTASGPVASIRRLYQGYRNWKKNRGRRKREYRRFMQRKRFYSEFIKAGDVCFDVGANIGTRTEAFLDLGAKVIAVEPQEKCARQLREKFGAHPNFILIEKALDQNEGIKEFYISNAHTLSSMSPEWIEYVKQENLFEGADWSTRTEVQTTTMDALIHAYGHPAFCKIDVEGFEFNVLLGLTRPVGVISFEFTRGLDSSTSNCIRYLEKIGYHRFNYSIGETMSLRLKDWIRAEEMIAVLSSKPKNEELSGDVYCAS